MSEKTDKELADALVALGIGEKLPEDEHETGSVYSSFVYIAPGDHKYHTQTDDDFVRDWRVAGAVMEQMTSMCFDTSGEGWLAAKGFSAEWDACYSESLPRAIIEAGVAALGAKS